MNLTSSLAYAFYILRRPFDGFWCLKSERRGSLKAAAVFIGLFLATMLFRVYATDYLASSISMEDFSPWLLIVIILGLYFLFVVANWSLTTLMDGSGSFRDILIATAYALLPIILVNVPLTLFSHIITQSEMAFFHFFNTIAIIWTVFLLLSANMATHDYSMTKSIATAVLTVLIMFIIVILGILFVNLIQQVWVFILSVYKEISFRI